MKKTARKLKSKPRYLVNAHSIIDPTSDGTYVNMHKRLCGEIRNHPDFEDGAVVILGRAASISKTGRAVKTLAGFSYRLAVA